MAQDSNHYTATMAGLFADQGYLRKAADIYRYLIKQDPDRTDLQQALASVIEQMAVQKSPTRKELTLLLREWNELIIAHKKMKKNQ